MNLKPVQIFALLLFVALLVVLSSFVLMHDRDTGDGQKVDWTQKASDIALHDPEFRAVTGDRQKLVGGIVWEGSNADLYYQTDNTIYNVSVNFKSEAVTSIKEERDQKRLEWLRNISSNMTSTNVTVISTIRTGP
jgi:hypothetical protein